MSKNQLEKRQLDQINETSELMSEGFIGNALIRLIFGSRSKKILKMGVKAAKDDPELQATFSNFEKQYDQLLRDIDSLCKRNPDHPTCK